MEKEVYIEHLLGVHLIMVTCWSDPSMIGWDSSFHSWFFVSSTLKRLPGTGYSLSGQPPSQTCHWNARLVYSFQGKRSLCLLMSWSIGNKSVKSRKNKNCTMHSFGPPGSFVQYTDAALSPLRYSSLCECTPSEGLSPSSCPRIKALQKHQIRVAFPKTFKTYWNIVVILSTNAWIQMLWSSMSVWAFADPAKRPETCCAAWSAPTKMTELTTLMLPFIQ